MAERIKTQSLHIAGKTFDSRLFTGTGKFASAALMARAIAESGSELVTMALKRVRLDGQDEQILAPLQSLAVNLLPNTSGARTAEEAIFAARLARSETKNSCKSCCAPSARSPFSMTG